MPTAAVPTPGTPPAPAAARRAPRRCTPPAATSGRTGEMEFQLQRLDPPLRLRQVARDPSWDRFKTVMVIIGGLLFFWVFGEKMFLWGRSFPQQVGQVWTPVQPVQPTRPAPQQPAPPQVIVNVPDRIQIDATVRDVTIPPPAPAPSRELTPEEKAEKLKQEIRAQYGVR